MISYTQPVAPGFRRGQTMTWVPPSAARQKGVFTTSDAARAGCSRARIDFRLASGAWRTVVGRGLVLAGTPVGFAQIVWAAVLTWPDAVLWGPTALRIWRPKVPLPTVQPNTEAIHLAVPHARSPQTGMVAHRCPNLTERFYRLNGLPTVSELDAVADTLLTLPDRNAERLLGWVIARQVINTNEIEPLLAARAGGRGMRHLRKYLDQVQTGIGSYLEGQLHRLLNADCLTGWKANMPIKVAGRIIASADICFEEAKVIVEADGSQFHSTLTAIQQDQERSNALQAAGYRVLRFNYDTIMNHPATVTTQIRQALARHTP